MQLSHHEMETVLRVVSVDRQVGYVRFGWEHTQVAQEKDGLRRKTELSNRHSCHVVSNAVDRRVHS